LLPSRLFFATLNHLTTTSQEYEMDRLNEAEERIARQIMESDKPQDKAKVAYISTAYAIFRAITLCVCVSHNRLPEYEKIIRVVLFELGDFVADHSDNLTSKDALDEAFNTIMIRARALVEDALGVKRFDGTENGS
jgi:hypothetical protein